MNYFFPDGNFPNGIEEVNYFDAGLINSLGIIDLIERIESHFQERRFSTIKGLSEIIHELQLETMKQSEIIS